MCVHIHLHNCMHVFIIYDSKDFVLFVFWGCGTESEIEENGDGRAEQAAKHSAAGL